MATDSQPNGRERLDLSLGGKTFGIAARDLIPILLLIGGLTGGYLVYVNVMDAFKLIYHRQEQTLTLLREQTEKIRRLFVTHEWNQGKEPRDHLPLDLEPPVAPAPRAPQ